MTKIVHLDIATMMPTNRQGEGTADWQTYDSDFMEFVSGVPCTKCVEAEFTKDRHSICELMIDKRA